jgi:predicted ester cyclase
MNAKETETFIRTSLDLLWNQGDLAAGHDLFRANVVLHYPFGLELKGVKAAVAHAVEIRRLAPNLYLTVQEVLVVEDRVALRYHWTGSFVGGMTPLGPALAGKLLNVDGQATFHLLDEQVAAGWVNEDWLSMYAQLGLVKPALAAAA